MARQLIGTEGIPSTVAITSVHVPILIVDLKIHRAGASVSVIFLIIA